MTELIKLSDDLYTFTIYMRQRRNRQMRGFKFNAAMQTTETVKFLKDLRHDLDKAIIDLCDRYPCLIETKQGNLFDNA